MVLFTGLAGVSEALCASVADFFGFVAWPVCVRASVKGGVDGCISSIERE